MTVGVTVTFNSKQLTKLVTRLPEEIPKNLSNVGFRYTRKVSKALRLAAVTDPLRPITPNRQAAAMRIRAKKLSKFRSVVTMPRSLLLLDGMQKHYVSLKRGRNISRWARKNYGNAVVGGKSHVKRGPRGGVIGGFLFVTPHKFVQKTLAKERNKLPNMLRGGLKKAIQASRI